MDDVDCENTLTTSVVLSAVEKSFENSYISQKRDEACNFERPKWDDKDCASRNTIWIKYSNICKYLKNMYLICFQFLFKKLIELFKTLTSKVYLYLLKHTCIERIDEI